MDLDLNAYANARAHFEQRRAHAVKQAKTVAANERALKAAERKAEQQLSQVTSSHHLQRPSLDTISLLTMLSWWSSQDGVDHGEIQQDIISLTHTLQFCITAEGLKHPFPRTLGGTKMESLCG